MASIRLIVEYDGLKAEECILVRDEIQESLRRVRIKRVPCPVDEVTYQVLNELNATIANERLLKKLIRSIVDQINQSS